MKSKIVKLVVLATITIVATSGCGKPLENHLEENVVSSENEVETEVINEATEVNEFAQNDNNTKELKDDGVTAECGIVDPSNIHFYINGEKYTIGDVTLQDLMDNGVTIGNYKNTDILAFIGDASDYEYTIELGNGKRVGVETINDVDEPAHTSECKVWYIGWCASDAGGSDAIKFDFPTDITEDKLKEIAGEPTEVEQYADIIELSYIKEAGETECGGKYVFSFIDGELIGVSLYWKPSYEILSKEASGRGWQYLPD